MSLQNSAEISRVNDISSQYRKLHPLGVFAFVRIRLYFLNKSDAVNPLCKQYNFSKQTVVAKWSADEIAKYVSNSLCKSNRLYSHEIFKHQSSDDIKSYKATSVVLSLTQGTTCKQFKTR